MNPGNTPRRNDASGNRQGLRTPRFIFSSSQPSGPGSATPFAATPRFLLGQEKRRRDGDELHSDEIETSEGELPLPSTVERSASARRPRGRRSDAEAPARGEIPDSEDDYVDAAASPCGSWMNDGDAMDIPEMEDEDEYDLLFPPSPTRPSAKRRRVSPPPTRRRQAHLPSLSPQESSPPPLRTHEPAASEHADEDVIASPRNHRPPSGALATTSSQVNPSSSTRQPRFILNPSPHALHPPSTSTQHESTTTPSAPPPSHGAAEPTSTSTTAAPTTPRRKPHFILPLTPSRRDPNDPAPPPSTAAPSRADPLFSPSTTRTTGRPGRPSARRAAGGQEYLPGGMAAQVRNWIFELSANRQASLQQEQQEHQQEQQRGHAQARPTSSAAREPESSTQRGDALRNVAVKQHHYLTTEVGQVATSLPSFSQRRSGRTGGGRGNDTPGQTQPQASGPGHAAPATVITPSRHHRAEQDTSATGWRKILLFGAPLSTPPAGVSGREGGEDVVGRLRAGDWVGVRRGVVWEMEIRVLRGVDTGQAEEGELEKWLVGVDWDILSRRAAG